MIIKLNNVHGELVSKDLDITQEQYEYWLHNHVTSKEAFPQLSDKDLLFFDNGLTSEEYSQIIKQKSK